MKRFYKLIRQELPRIILGSVLFVLALVFDGVEPLSLILYILALLVAGFPVFVDAVKGILRRDLLDEKFLMSIASVGAMIIGEYTEGVAVMLFFLVGEYFEHRAVRSSRNAIKSLMDICPDTARVLVDGEEIECDSDEVDVGSVIVIRPGERVPIDCEIISGECELDTSSMTGESVPVYAKSGDEIYSGVVVLDGLITARTLRVMEESRASRVLSLVELSQERKSKEENFITKFSKVYTPIVTVLALIMAIIPPIFSILTPEESVYRALSFLVVSCPCALVISVPMSFFGGIGCAASLGVLYKGGNTFSPVSRAGSVVFDKTGTLTTGEFSITEVKPVGIDEKEFLTLVASVEEGSNHPVAKCLKKASVERVEVTSTRELAGKGVVSTVGEETVAVGNSALLEYLGIEFERMEGTGVVYAARGESYLGYIRIKDTVKPEAKEVIKELKRLGVKKTYILSGDGEEAVGEVGEALAIDEYHARLTPEEKFSRLESIIESGSGTTVYVGDGINDAPCLSRADVGIAMGNRNTDSATEASDVVIMSGNLDRITDSIKIARKTLTIAKENIVFAIGVKLLVLLLVAIDLAGMWLAVFADVGVAVLAILNSMRALRLGRK